MSDHQRITLLDGGMGREILRMGGPFGQPEWSARALIQSPEHVQRAHEAFALAGSDILTTSNYAVVPFHIGEDRFSSVGYELIALAGKLAQKTAQSYGCSVAGSLPPMFGSYRPDLFIEEKAPAILQVIIDALNPYVDLWLAETLSSLGEARVIAAAVKEDDRPLWMSFTLMDGKDAETAHSCLRSGETVENAVESVILFGASAILFNCSRPEVMSPALRVARRVLKRRQATLRVGVYANAFPSQGDDEQANVTLHEIRKDLDPENYLTYAKQWRELGATIIGGCCGIGPEHIATLHQLFSEHQ